MCVFVCMCTCCPVDYVMLYFLRRCDSNNNDTTYDKRELIVIDVAAIFARRGACSDKDIKMWIYMVDVPISESAPIYDN